MSNPLDDFDFDPEKLNELPQTSSTTKAIKQEVEV